jgi:hypothetical protein
MMDDRDLVKRKIDFVRAFSFQVSRIGSEKVGIDFSPKMIHGLPNIERISHNK